jgi:hypothetical protein
LTIIPPSTALAVGIFALLYEAAGEPEYLIVYTEERWT